MGMGVGAVAGGDTGTEGTGGELGAAAAGGGDLYSTLHKIKLMQTHTV